jgi:anthranilate synthase component 2
MTERLLILDNYDSFTYNLVHLVEKVCEIPFDVRRNDEISLENVSQYSKILLSPGPGLPRHAGIMPALLKTYSSTRSILGVCLGMQAIGEAFGSKLRNLEIVSHGIASPVIIQSQDLLFEKCPKSFNVGRYHSWVIDPEAISKDLIITATDESRNIMAVRHRSLDVRGVQFHPESILSEYGEEIISSWLRS